MGYRIIYGGVKKVRGTERRTSRRAALTGLFFLIFLILVQSLWPRGAAIVKGFLVPKAASVMVVSLEEAASELKSGEGLRTVLEDCFLGLKNGSWLD